jgi:hypothetical protein
MPKISLNIYSNTCKIIVKDGRFELINVQNSKVDFINIVGVGGNEGTVAIQATNNSNINIRGTPKLRLFLNENSLMTVHESTITEWYSADQQSGILTLASDYGSAELPTLNFPAGLTIIDSRTIPVADTYLRKNDAPVITGYVKEEDRETLKSTGAAL